MALLANDMLYRIEVRIISPLKNGTLGLEVSIPSSRWVNLSGGVCYGTTTLKTRGYDRSVMSKNQIKGGMCVHIDTWVSIDDLPDDLYV